MARVDAPSRLTLWQMAPEASDRGRAARLAMEEEGMIVVSIGKMPHANPLVKIEKDAAGTFICDWASFGRSPAPTRPRRCGAALPR